MTFKLSSVVRIAINTHVPTRIIQWYIPADLSSPPGQPLDPRKSIRTYNLQRQQLATGGLIEYHLQLDFWSGRWQAQAIVMS